VLVDFIIDMSGEKRDKKILITAYPTQSSLLTLDLFGQNSALFIDHFFKEQYFFWKILYQVFEFH